jgi:tetratricopeptide (TPR) repeat protein
LKELGIVQRQTGEYKKAAATLTKAAEIYRALRNRHGEAHALCDLCTARYEAGDRTAATITLARALELFHAISDRRGRAERLNDMGGIVLDSADRRARCYYEQALTIARSIASPREEARALEGIGRCHLKDGKLSRAQLALEQALARYNQLHLSDHSEQVAAILSELGA